MMMVASALAENFCDEGGVELPTGSAEAFGTVADVGGSRRRRRRIRLWRATTDSPREALSWSPVACGGVGGGAAPLVAMLLSLISSLSSGALCHGGYVGDGVG